MLEYGYFESPLGIIELGAENESLFKLRFVASVPEEIKNYSSPIIEEAKKQLHLYFSKQLRKFDLPLILKVTDFQKRVLEEVCKIPHGQTVTYLQLAHRMGSTKLTRAVAAANAANLLLIIIPCHRVIGKNNSMTGYAGEIWRKEWLLNHENALYSLAL